MRSASTSKPKGKWARFVQLHPDYEVWRNMMRNCGLRGGANGGPSSKYYRDKGITVCEQWRDYKTFSAWLGTKGWRPNANLVLCRTDRTKDFTPENCIICTKQRLQNYRLNVIRVNGRTIRDIAGACDYTPEEHTKLKRARQRYAKSGWGIEDSITVAKIPLVEQVHCSYSMRDTGFNRRWKEQKPLYEIWRDLRRNKQIDSAPCWKEYLDFEKWAVENGWKKGLKLERIDRSVGFHPSNCRFVGIKEYRKRPLFIAWESNRKKKVLCHEWESDFYKYEAWAIEHGWKRGLCVVRVDKSGLFSPDNCIVISQVENSMMTLRMYRESRRKAKAAVV